MSKKLLAITLSLALLIGSVAATGILSVGAETTESAPLYTVGLDFETESDKYTQYNCVSPYGMAAKVTTTYVPFTNPGAADDEALVFWISAKDQTETVKMQVFVMSNSAIYDTTSAAVSASHPLRPNVGTYTAINTAGEVVSITADANVSIPAGFEGWIILPFNSFLDHWATGSGNVTIAGGSLTQLQFQTNYQNFYFDQFGSTPDAEAFVAAAADGGADLEGFTGVHNYTAATCTTAATCADCGVTDGVPMGKYEAADYELFLDFDEKTPTQISNTTYVTVESGNGYSGNALRYNRGANGVASANGEWSYVYFPATGIANGEAMVFYATASTAASLYLYMLYDTSGATIKTNSGATFYTVSTDGTITPRTSGSSTFAFGAGFEGWVIIPNAAYTNIDTSRLSGFYMGCTGAWGTVFNLDNFGITADMDNFIAAVQAGDELTTESVYNHDWTDATCKDPKTCAICGSTEGEADGEHNFVGGVCTVCGTTIPLEELYNVALDFETADTAKYTQYTCVSPYGLAAKVTTTYVPFTNPGAAGDEALVFWVSAKDQTETKGIQVFVMSNSATYDTTSAAVAASHPLRPNAGTYTAINTAGEVVSITADANVHIPAGFEGWIILPFNSFLDHWATGSGNVTIAGGSLTQLQFQTNYQNFYFDQFGSTPDATAFAAWLTGETADYGHTYVGNACSVCGKALSTVINDCADTSNFATADTIESVGNVTPSGSALKWTRKVDGAVSLTAPLTSGNADDEALIFYVDTTEQIADTVIFTFHLNYVNSAAGYYLNAGQPYYLVTKDGVIENTFTGYNLPLAKDLQAWVIIPIASIKNATADKLTNFWMQTGTNLNSVLYIDDIGFAADVDAAKSYLADNLASQTVTTTVGSSINEAETALRFGYTMAVGNVTVDGYLRDITNATISLNGTEYKLVDFGAILSNNAEATLTHAGVDGSKTINIRAEKLYACSETEISFACGIKNIPESKKDALIYSRPYLIYSDGVNEITVYGEISQQSVNGYGA